MAPASTYYVSWVTRLRMSWMGTKAKAIWGGFAAVLGDKTIDWTNQANLEHLPKFASAPSVALIASERQLDVDPAEATQGIADREPYAVNISGFYGTPLGLLLGLHFAGFPGAIFVQQNGRACQLALPLPAFQDSWDPTGNQLITVLGGNPTLPGAGAGHAWWLMDLNDPFCSRFSIIYYGQPPSPFLTWGRAVFTGVEDGASVPWPTIVWNNVFPSSTYNILVGSPVSSGGAPPAVSFDPATQTATSVQTIATSPWTGYCDYIAYQVGANPFADPHPDALARLRATIAKWKPGKSTCVSISVCTQGTFNGWPVVDTSGGGAGVPSTVVEFSAT